MVDDKPKRGRPPKGPPGPIPDTPDRIIQTVVKTRKREKPDQETR